MKNIGPKTETWIDCILAIEKARFPVDQTIPSSSVLLAFLLAVTGRSMTKGTHALSDMFIAELRSIVLNPQPTSPQKIIEITQRKIKEETESPASDSIPQNDLKVLKFALNMLTAQLRTSAQS